MLSTFVERISRLCCIIAQLLLVVTMATCFILLVFLVLVAQPCGGFIFGTGDIKCSGQSYDQNSQICCRGRLYERPVWSVRCCADLLYRPDTHHCCHKNDDEVEVVEKEPDNPRWFTCSKIRETS
ncbi:hypothetical protein LSAT2_016227 [Lamellibrachia satsuma]|nr:hypothetical protein LSAT2_016227 [Lamellibrachia satsuma]